MIRLNIVLIWSCCNVNGGGKSFSISLNCDETQTALCAPAAARQAIALLLLHALLNNFVRDEGLCQPVAPRQKIESPLDFQGERKQSSDDLISI